jgi:hypothetical protein
MRIFLMSGIRKEDHQIFLVVSPFMTYLTATKTTSAMITKSIIAPTKSPSRNFIGLTFKTTVLLSPSGIRAEMTAVNTLV